MRTGGKPKCGCASSAARRTRTAFPLASGKALSGHAPRERSTPAASPSPLLSVIRYGRAWYRLIASGCAGRSHGLRSGGKVTACHPLRENPVRGFTAPAEANPKRPLASTDRYEALRAVSDQVPMEVYWDGSPRQRSYLSEVLDLAFGTGRRISAIRSLRYDDLRLDAKPYGAIRWPAATDKQGLETSAPITPTVRAALDRILRERPGIGCAVSLPEPTRRG